MKRTTLCILMLAAAVVCVFGNTQIRLTFESATELSGELSLDSAVKGFADYDNLFSGIHWELIHDHVGYGLRGLVRFQHEPGETQTYDWSMDWDGELHLGLHFLGAGRLLDPFVELGLGSAGRVLLGGGDAGTWVQAESGEWHYVPSEADPERRAGLQSMSLFPVVAAGLALDLRGVLVGARVSYRLGNEPVPATQFPPSPLSPLQVSLFGGCAFGGHR
jgi:hypothetical protein